MAEPVTVFGYLVPLGANGTDVAKFPIKRQLYVIGRYVGELQNAPDITGPKMLPSRYFLDLLLPQF